MAFAAKKDYCGLAEAGKLELRSATENKSVSVYSPDGEDGSKLAIEAYGENATPSNEYALKATIDQTATGATKWTLGKLTTIGTAPDQKKYRLTKITISTAVNSPVKVTAEAQLVEDGAIEVAENNYDVPQLMLTTKHIAQVLFNAFTHTGGNLISAEYVIGASSTLDTLVGNIISNGIGSAVITVTGTLLVSGDAEPTVTPVGAFVLTKPPTCQNPETAYRQYTFELQCKIAKNTPPTP